MSLRHVLIAVGLLVQLTACGPAEIRIDGSKGVPPVAGSTEVTLGTFVCGEPLSSGGETVSTRVVPGGCELTYSREAPVVRQSDYDTIPELKGVSQIVQRVELTISKLAFVDADSGAALDVSTRITSADMSINGQLVADKSALSSLPKVISLDGAALSSLKSQVDARQPASVSVRVVVVLPNEPKPPARLKIDYQAQPALILGPGKIF